MMGLFILNNLFYHIFIYVNILRSHIRKVLSESYEDSISEAKKPLRRVAGALIKDVTTDKVLLLKRNDKTPRWAMMTGEIDEGEDALDGLEREMYEELFIRPGSVRLNFMGVEHIPAKNIDLYYYEGFVKNQFKPHLDEENLDYGWFSLEDLPSPLLGGLYKKVSHILDKDNVYSDVKMINENSIRKQVRLIIEQKILSEHYLNEAIEILMEVADQPSPTFDWDLTGGEPNKDEEPVTFTWDLAKEKVDLSKKYVKTKEQAIEYLKNFFNQIKKLPRGLKIKIAKYVVSSFIGLVGVGVVSGLMSNTVPDIEKEVVTVVADKPVEKQEYVRPTQVSPELLDFLKHEEGSIRDKGEPVLKAYKLGDGAVTVGWGHAEKIGDTDLDPGERITRAQAEAYFKEDVAEAKSYVDDMLSDWEKEGIRPKITQSMYDAMVSMVYNMGIGTFRFSERSENLINYLKTSQFEKAEEEIMKISGHLYKKFPGLKNRREAEAEIFGFDSDSEQGSRKLAMKEIRSIIRKTIKQIV